MIELNYYCLSNFKEDKENNIKLTIIKNEKDGYVVELDNDKCMAEIVVEEPTYTPYRYISFE
ncbi:hypothetical protein MTZ58_001963, partial [Listeria monocytogenes]|nr:hypothetical protein [Listeria monocytogenes]